MAEQPPKTTAPIDRRATAWMVLALVLTAAWVVYGLSHYPGPTTRVPYSVFRAQAATGNIKSVRSRELKLTAVLHKPIEYPAGRNDVRRVVSERPAYARDHLLAVLERGGAEVDARPPSGNAIGIVLSLLPLVVIAGLFLLVRRQGSMGGGMRGPGMAKRVRVSRSEGAPQTTFADVAGIDEATAELEEVVDFLRRPDHYRRLGGTIPRGVLLTGPPGTGKTLLARAVAGEAGVPFFSISASEFVEMFVGVGASRVRDLFAQAKKEAPSILFVDELDAIGRARGAGMGTGSNEEREQTLNQLLTEMDGFTGTEGVIVLAATNRPEVLDPALFRAGRFDRRIAVNAPDRKGRVEILRVHTRGVPLSLDVHLDQLAGATPGMVGADLRTLVNEAALRAARHVREEVTALDFEEALERMLLGAARRIVLSEEERRRTAYHEAGHALLGMLQPGADPVSKVSIIPRGHALGVTVQRPVSDRYGYGERYLRGRIVGLLGGRAAEQLVFEEATTGAETDLEQATALARRMVGRWGMSETLGLASRLPAEDSGHPPALAQETLRGVDEETSRIVAAAYVIASDTLRAHRRELDGVAEALLVHETLDEGQARAAAGIGPREDLTGTTVPEHTPHEGVTP